MHTEAIPQAFLTLQCNFNCKYCFLKKSRSDIISGDDWLEILNNQPGNSVILTGGEPTLHPDFLQIVNGLQKEHVQVFTNLSFDITLFANIDRKVKIIGTYHPGNANGKSAAETVWTYKRLIRMGHRFLSIHVNKCNRDAGQQQQFFQENNVPLETQGDIYQQPPWKNRSKLGPVICNYPRVYFGPDGKRYSCIHKMETMDQSGIIESTDCPTRISCSNHGDCNPVDYSLCSVAPTVFGNIETKPAPKTKVELRKPVEIKAPKTIEYPVFEKDKDQKVYASMATYPARKKPCGLAIQTILPQVDQLNVYLNGYKKVPEFLKHPKINAIIGKRNLGAKGKLFFVSQFSGYHIIIDDDLLYPPDFVLRMIAKVEEYERKSVVGVLGSEMINPIKSYKSSRICWRYSSPLEEDRVIDIIGTGAMAFHSDTVSKNILDHIEQNNMVDPFFAKWARGAGVPFVIIARGEQWIDGIPGVSPGIYERVVCKDDSIQTAVCHEIFPPCSQADRAPIKGPVPKHPIRKIPRFGVGITTFNRPDSLMELLLQLDDWRDVYDLKLVIVDDGSSADYSSVKKWCRYRPWITFRTNKKNHGKKGYYKRVNQVLKFFRGLNADRFVLLQDDFRICSGFFSAIIAYWAMIEDGHRAALDILVQNDKQYREGHWGSARPVSCNFGGSVFDNSGWMDCAWFMPRKTLERLGWKLEKPPKDYWDGAPFRGSGVGEFISRRVRKIGNIYRTEKSLIRRVQLPSLMHPKERSRHPMIEINFYDDFKPPPREMITFSFAAIPSRREFLKRVIDAILPQADRINVYLNGYPDVPDCLKNEKIVAARSQDSGDLSDTGKFFWLTETKGFSFILDDDVLIAPNYVDAMLAKIRQYGKHIVAANHGSIFIQHPIENYFSRKSRKILAVIEKDTQVHGAGTGSIVFHHSAIDFGLKDCPLPEMTDVWFALAAKKQKVPLVVMANRDKRIEILASRGPGLYEIHCAAKGIAQTQLINKAMPWPEPTGALNVK